MGSRPVWNGSLRPTLTAPAVSPWYASPSATKRERSGWPACRWASSAIRSAASTAVAPDSP